MLPRQFDKSVCSANDDVIQQSTIFLEAINNDFFFTHSLATVATPPLVSWYQGLNAMAEFAARIASFLRREPNTGGGRRTSASYPNTAEGIRKT